MSGDAITLQEMLNQLRHPGIDDPVILAFWLGLPLLVAWWVELRYWPRGRGRPTTRRGLLVGALVSMVFAGLLYVYLYDALRTGLIHCIPTKRSGGSCLWRCEYGAIGCDLVKPPKGKASMIFTAPRFWASYLFFATLFLMPFLAWTLVCLKAFASWSRMPWRSIAWSRRD